MSRLVIAADQLSKLRNELLQFQEETCAVLFGGSVNVGDGHLAGIVVRDVVIAPLDRYDRQIRVFGSSIQRQLRSLRIAVVGVGGTGSIIAQELAHLGVADFLFLDPDTVAETNLNRLAGATRNDLGRLKVGVARDLV